MNNECISCGNRIPDAHVGNPCQSCHDEVKERGSNHREALEFRNRAAQRLRFQGMDQSYALMSLGVTKAEAEERVEAIRRASYLHSTHHRHDTYGCSHCSTEVADELKMFQDALSRHDPQTGGPLSHGLIPNDIIEKAAVAAGRSLSDVADELMRAGWKRDDQRDAFVAGDPQPVRWIEWVLGFRKTVTKTDIIQAEARLDDWKKKLEGSRWQ